jgi:hypothetical protein
MDLAPKKTAASVRTNIIASCSPEASAEAITRSPSMASGINFN